MGEIRGDISVFSFPDLFQHLSSLRRPGTLKISQGPLEKSVYMSPEGLRLASSNGRITISLGEILIRTHRITRADLHRLLAEQQKTGQRFGEVLRRAKLVTRNDIDIALREQVQEEIYDLIGWTDARFEFVEGPPPLRRADFPLAEVLVDASPTSILLEASRRADELRVILKEIGSDASIPARAVKPFTAEGHGLPPDLVAAVYGSVDGKAPVDAVVRFSLYPRFEALRALYLLSRRGFLSWVRRAAPTIAPLDSLPSLTPLPTPATTAGRALLLLGDMVRYRQVLAALLHEAGYEVLQYSPSSAISCLSENRRLDAVVLDVGLSTENGLAFIGWLRKNTKVPIVVLSADTSPEGIRATLAQGVRAYVAKPFTREGILKAVSAIFVTPKKQA